MKNQRLKYLATGLLTVGFMAFNGSVQAQTVNSVIEQVSSNVNELRSVQRQIDGVAEQTDKLEQDYKVVLKQVEGLKVYNAQQDLQIADQNRTLESLERSIAGAATMERDILPLMINMIDGLEQFVGLDLPFSVEERQERVVKLRDNLGRSNLSTAEMFRQVLEAYKIELDYGNNIESYTQTETINGAEQDVNILRVGRVALMYQTKDQSSSAAWNNESKSWEALDASWNSEISQGIKIAKKQAPIEIMTVPVPAPQEASR